MTREHNLPARTRLGFTLLELLISMLIGVLVLAGLSTVLFHASTVRRITTSQADMLERGHYALATLEPDIEMAGYYGLGNNAAREGAALGGLALPPCGAELVLDLQSRLRVISNAVASTCTATRGGLVSGTSSITIWRLSRRPAAAEAGRVQVVTHALPHPAPLMLSDGHLPPDVNLVSNQNELRNLIIRTYYIARQSDGDQATPSLRVKTLTSIGGAPAFVDTEVIPGVENMQIRALPDDSSMRYVEVSVTIRAAKASSAQRSARGPFRFVRTISLQHEA